MMNTNNRKQWEQWDSQYVWHPYTQMLLSPDAIGVKSASGSYITLSNGDKVFDSISSWWLTLHGHCHPVIAEAIAKQSATLDQVIFAGFTHPAAAELSKKLVERVPSNLQKVFFSDDGSTAVEVALKMSIQYWQSLRENRTTFLAIEGCYHGDTFGAMSVSARGSFAKPFESLLFDVIHLPFPTPPTDNTEIFSEAEEKFLSTLEIESKKDGIAAFIYEPLLLGAGGMKVWRAPVLEAALKIVTSHGVLSIADEVLTGFGRTGSFFASDQCSISPDILTASKGITGGFLPLGVTIATEAIYNSFLSTDRAKTFFHGHSYTGNSISCAAAVASLSIFESEPVFDRIATINAVHHERMPILAARLDQEYRILGTIAATQPRNPLGYLSHKSLTLGNECLERGLLLRPLGDTVYFLPPYSSTAEDLHRAYDILDDVM